MCQDCSILHKGHEQLHIWGSMSWGYSLDLLKDNAYMLTDMGEGDCLGSC
jgi:hypothetical protein